MLFRKSTVKVLVLVVVLLIGISGCISYDNENKVSQDTTTVPQQTETGKNSNTLPITDKPLKLTYFMVLDGKAAASMKSLDEMGMWKEVQKRTGIDIEFQHPPVGQQQEQFKLMLASGSYPDLINYALGWLPGGSTSLVNDGVIIGLNEYIDDYAPTFKKILDENPEAKKQSMLDDGTIFVFGGMNIDMKARVAMGYLIRNDWLKKLNLDPPTTIEEWYNVLTAFKENDPNGNNEKDEIPFISRKDGDMHIKCFSSAWGVRPTFCLDPDSGKVKYGPIQPEYKEFLLEMAKWYEEGLIDHEYALVDNNNFEAKILNDKAGACYGLISGTLGKMMNLMADQNPEFSLIGITAPIGKAGKAYVSNSRPVTIVENGTSITTSNKYVIESVRLMDYLYTEEGNLLASWGIEGESYEVVNGKKVLTDLILNNPDGLTVDQAMAKYAHPHYVAGPQVVNVEAREPLVLSLPEQKASLEAWLKDDASILIPPVYPLASESSKLASIMNEVNTYESEMFNKFIMGDVSITDKFDEYVAQIKSMGIDEAVRIMQDAVDRYNRRF